MQTLSFAWILVLCIHNVTLQAWHFRIMSHYGKICVLRTRNRMGGVKALSSHPVKILISVTNRSSNFMCNRGFVVGSTCRWSSDATGWYAAGLWVDFTDGGERKNCYEDKKKVWHLRFTGQQNWGKLVEVYIIFLFSNSGLGAGKKLWCYVFVYK